MFDLETLNTEADSVVLSLGAVIFNPVTGEFLEEILLKPNIDEQFGNGRTHSDSTVEWWSKQSQEVQDAAFGEDDRISVEEFLTAFRKFANNCDKVWSQGSMDPKIMEHMYKAAKMPVPWAYWAEKDSRTLFDFIEPNMDRSKHHDALEDAREQAKGVCNVLKKIGWKGKKL